MPAPNEMRIRTAGYHLRIALASGFAGWLDPVEQVFDEVLEYRGVELVDDLLAISLGDDEPRIAQNGEMARNGRPGARKGLSDLPGRARPVAQQAEDVAPGWVGEGFEGIVHGTRNILVD